MSEDRLVADQHCVAAAEYWLDGHKDWLAGEQDLAGVGDEHADPAEHQHMLAADHRHRLDGDDKDHADQGGSWTL